MPESDDWTQEQNYFDYRRTGFWPRREMPTVDPALVQELNSICGLAPNGKPRTRLNFGGVCTIRQFPLDRACEIIGNREALYRPYGLDVPIYLAGRKEVFDCHVYRDSKGVVHTVTRRDEIPEGVVSNAKSAYLDFGELRWHVENWLSREDLVKARHYRPNDEYLPPDGAYISVHQVETSHATPRYLALTEDVGRVLLEQMRATAFNTRNVNLPELLRRRRERRELDDQNREAEADAQLSSAVAESLAYHQDQQQRNPVSMILGG